MAERELQAASMHGAKAGPTSDQYRLRTGVLYLRRVSYDHNRRGPVPSAALLCRKGTAASDASNDSRKPPRPPNPTTTLIK